MSITIKKIRDFIGHQQAVYSFCFDQNHYVYSGGGDGFLVQWHINEDDGVLIAKHDCAIYSVQSFDDLVLTGNNQGELSVFNIKTFELIKKIKFNTNAIFDIQKHKELLYLACSSGEIIVLNMNFEIVVQHQLSTKSIRQMKFYGNEMIVAGSEPSVWVLDLNFKQKQKYTDFNSSVFGVDFHLEDQLLICGGRDAVLDFLKDEEKESIKAHLLHVNDIKLNPEQTYFLSASMDKTVKLWDWEKRRLLKVIDFEKYQGHTSSVNKILWFDKNKFISCSDDRTLKCYEIQGI